MACSPRHRRAWVVSRRKGPKVMWCSCVTGGSFTSGGTKNGITLHRADTIVSKKANSLSAFHWQFCPQNALSVSKSSAHVRKEVLESMSHNNKKQRSYGTHQGSEEDAKRSDRKQEEDHACHTECHKAGDGQAQPPLHHQPQRQGTGRARTDQG